MGTSQNLKEIFLQEINCLAQSFGQYPWEDRATYGLWLAQTCYLVRHTTRLLGLAAGNFGPSKERWHQVTLDGLKEERGHDKLAENDIFRLGYQIEDLPELSQTAAIYQSQYYRVMFTGPVSLFGYALMLEGLVSEFGPHLVETMDNAHGKSATSFMRVHVIHDDNHFEEGLKALDGISDEEASGVIANLVQSRVLYESMMRGVQEEVAANRIEQKIKSA